jgi:hypothetical protein
MEKRHWLSRRMMKLKRLRKAQLIRKAGILSKMNGAELTNFTLKLTKAIWCRKFVLIEMTYFDKINIKRRLIRS